MSSAWSFMLTLLLAVLLFSVDAMEECKAECMLYYKIVKYYNDFIKHIKVSLSNTC